jgi:hypothetical protein
MALLYRYVTSNDLGNCPCAVDCNTGIVEVNRDVWNKYNEIERRFLLAHEEGHYYLDTDDETEADIYALRKLAGTTNNSLAKCIGALLKVDVIDDGRYYRLYKEALKIDQSKGNKQAINELNKLEKQMRKYRYAEGDEPESPEQEPESQETFEEVEVTASPKNQYAPNGIVFCGYYFSFTNILLIIIAFILYNLKRQ